MQAFPYKLIFTFFSNLITEWYWKCVVKPWGLRFLSIFLIGFSMMVVWSECLFFVQKPVLSLFALFVQFAKQNYDYFYIEVNIVMQKLLCDIFSSIAL